MKFAGPARRSGKLDALPGTVPRPAPRDRAGKPWPASTWTVLARQMQILNGHAPKLVSQNRK